MMPIIGMKMQGIFFTTATSATTSLLAAIGFSSADYDFRAHVFFAPFIQANVL